MSKLISCIEYLLKFVILDYLKDQKQPLNQGEINIKTDIIQLDRKADRKDHIAVNILKILESEGKVTDLNKDKSKGKETKWQITPEGKEALKDILPNKLPNKWLSRD